GVVCPKFGSIWPNGKRSTIYEPLRDIKKSKYLAWVPNLRGARLPADIERPLFISIEPLLQRIAASPQHARIACNSGFVRWAAINGGRLDVRKQRAPFDIRCRDIQISVAQDPRTLRRNPVIIWIVGIFVPVRNQCVIVVPSISFPTHLKLFEVAEAERGRRTTFRFTQRGQ